MSHQGASQSPYRPATIRKRANEADISVSVSQGRSLQKGDTTTAQVNNCLTTLLGHSRMPTQLPGNSGYLVPGGTRFRTEKRNQVSKNFKNWIFTHVSIGVNELSWRYIRQGNVSIMYYIYLVLLYSSPKDRSVPHRGGGEQPSRGMPGGAIPSGVKAIGWRTS